MGSLLEELKLRFTGVTEHLSFAPDAMGGTEAMAVSQGSTGDRVRQLWWVRGSQAGLASFDDLLCSSEIDDLEGSHVLGRDPGRLSKLLVWRGHGSDGDSPALLASLARAPAPSWLHLEDTSLHLRTVAEERSDLKAFLNRLDAEFGNPLGMEVVRVGCLDPSSDAGGVEADPAPTGAISEAESQCLEAAFESGYYQIPRENGVREIGEALGISKSLVSERLRRLEREGMQRLYEAHQENRSTWDK